jgi:hypothetical protein
LGVFYPTTDSQGRFTLPEVPVGWVEVAGLPPAGSPWFIGPSIGGTVEAGRTTRMEIKPIKGVRRKGVVRERGTGAPIVGARTSPWSWDEADANVPTDADGRFTAFTTAEYPGTIMVYPPEGFAQPLYGLSVPKVPEGVAESDLPPIELSRAGTVRGVVVDDRGEPVPGAEIMASWPVDGGPNARGGRQERRAISGRRGEFLIGGVVAGAPVDLSAVAPDRRRTSRSVGSRPGAEPARLVLDSSDSVSLAGRVVDAAGHRVAGARVHLRVQLRHSTGQAMGDALVGIRGAYVIRTDDTGWYRTPSILDPEREYAAFVEADDFEPALTNWTSGKARTFPELVLRPPSLPGQEGE